MELTKVQTQNLVNAVKAYRAAKRQVETATANAVAKLDKLKETCQGAGAEQQVLATAYELLAAAYISMPEDPGEI